MAKLEWREWNKEAFEEAADAGKFILLDISAVWCHWCHVMDETTYEDKTVIELINKNCVPIKVDVDKQPDIAERYNTGGYPTTAFLTSAGEFIDGTTYLPPQDFIKALTKLAQIVEETGTIEVSGAFQKHVDQFKKFKPATKLDPQAESKLFDIIKQQADPVNGGLQGAPKFPLVDVVRLCWAVGSKDAEQMAQALLKGMLKLHDNVEGGFFRYAVKSDWSEPHYEKLLDVNAKLLELYHDAFLKYKDPEYKRVADATLNYVLTTLKLKNGFSASQDANEEYYKAAKRGKKAPSVDEVIYTDRNAQMIVALLKTNDIKGMKVAKEVLDFIIKNLVKDNLVYHFYADKKAQHPGLLIDVANLVHALLEATERLQDASYLEVAHKITESAMKHLWDNGFKDRAAADDIGYLKEPLFSINENAVMAQNLDRLARLMKRADYALEAKKTLLRFGNYYIGYHVHACSYALVVKKLLA